MPGGHWSEASGPGGRNVCIVFHLNSSFILLAISTAHKEGERDVRKWELENHWLQSPPPPPPDFTHSPLKHIYTQENIMHDGIWINRVNIKRLLHYNSFAQRDKNVFVVTVLYKTHREKEEEREQIEVLLQHIQIYPGDVLPNMQDLFMSANISASHLQTESAALTAQHNQALCGAACPIRRGSRLTVWSGCSHLLTRATRLQPLKRISASKARRRSNDAWLSWEENKPPGRDKNLLSCPYSLRHSIISHLSIVMTTGKWKWSEVSETSNFFVFARRESFVLSHLKDSEVFAKEDGRGREGEIVMLGGWGRGGGRLCCI